MTETMAVVTAETCTCCVFLQHFNIKEIKNPGKFSPDTIFRFHKLAETDMS